MKQVPIMLLGAVFVAGGLPCLGQEARDELARQIRQKVEQVQAVRAQYRSAQAEYEAQQAEIDKQVQRLRTDLAAVGAEQRALGERVAQDEQSLKAQQASAGQARAAVGQMAAQSLPVVQDLQQRIERGIPFRAESRTALLGGIAGELHSGDAVAQATAMARLWSFLGEEVRLSRTTQMWNQEVPLADGRARHAYIVRLGLVNQVLATEQQDMAGLSDTGSAGGWRMNLDSPAQQQIFDAIDVLRQRRPPQLVLVPFLPRAASSTPAAPASP